MLLILFSLTFVAYFSPSYFPHFGNAKTLNGHGSGWDHGPCSSNQTPSVPEMLRSQQKIIGRFKLQNTDVSTHKINSSALIIYKIVLWYQVSCFNIVGKVWFFIEYLYFSNTDIQFAEKEFVSRSHTM